MAKIIVILQSNYIPWKGYLDLLNVADLFVLYDEVQYTRRDWRNRNKIVINGKVQWLTIPVETKGNYLASVKEMKVADNQWAQKHWASIRNAYGKAEYFSKYEERLSQAYERASETEYLSDINELFLRLLAEFLGIETEMAKSDEIKRTSNEPVERLIEVCQGFNATAYLSGPAAKNYINPERFADAGLELFYADYSGYPEYTQKTHVFEHGVSVIDLLMRLGPEARNHLKSVNDRQSMMIK